MTGVGLSMLRIATLVLALTTPIKTQISCPEDSICVHQDDLATMLKILEERKCLDQTIPVLKTDPILVVTDEDGRVYYSGNDPIPYTLTMDWCNYHIEAEGEINVTVAMKQPKTWGFRFRPKAHLGYLPLRPLVLDNVTAADGVDAGLAVDFVYYKFVNLNAYAGFRSVGVGPGVDITKNFGGMLAYSLSYTEPYHGFYAGISFAF